MTDKDACRSRRELRKAPAASGMGHSFIGRAQILVKTEACGVCHADLHAAHGDWPLKPIRPFSFPAMRRFGLVAGTGSGVTIVKEGDRVGVPWLYSACGHCEYCLKAWETVCPQAEFGGYTRNGGFADFLADPNLRGSYPGRACTGRRSAPSDRARMRSGARSPACTRRRPRCIARRKTSA